MSSYQFTAIVGLMAMWAAISTGGHTSIHAAIQDNGCKETMLDMPGKQEIRKTYKLNNLGE